MGDAERWLVEKENEKGDGGGEGTKDNEPPLEETVNEMRDELIEMQGSIGEFGREMAKLATLRDAITCFNPSCVHGPSDQFILRHLRTDEFPNFHSLQPDTSQVSIPAYLPAATSADAIRSAHHFIPPSAIRSQQPRSRLPYPTGLHFSLRLRSTQLATNQLLPDLRPPVRIKPKNHAVHTSTSIYCPSCSSHVCRSHFTTDMSLLVFHMSRDLIHRTGSIYTTLARGSVLIAPLSALAYLCDTIQFHECPGL